jgi:hypothetical protein
MRDAEELKSAIALYSSSDASAFGSIRFAARHTTLHSFEAYSPSAR